MTREGAEAGIRVERPQKMLRELALEKMRDAITGGYFKPGDRLLERDLCNLLGVSRTVVREALRHLESEGFVTSAPSRGPMVAALDADEARQIYEIRGALEGMAARLCAEKRDPGIADSLDAALEAIRLCYAKNEMAGVLERTTDFYRLLFSLVGRQVAWDIEQRMTGRINHLRSLTIRTTGRALQGPAQMALIVSHIRRGDGPAAEAAAIEHVNSACRIALGLLAERRNQEGTTKQTDKS